MKDSKRTVKRVMDQQVSVEISELTKMVPLVLEFNKLLVELESDSIDNLEKKLNKRTGFTNASMSAMAYGLEAPYKRLLDLEKLLDGRLTSEDITSTGKLKKEVTDRIIEANTIYYTDEELKAVTDIKEIMDKFNALDVKVRSQLGFNRSSELVLNPFSYLIR